MKNKTITTLCTIIIIMATGITTKVFSQNYEKAIGLNLGSILGVNYKHFISTQGALEYSFGYQRPGRGVMLTALYQYHFNLVDNLNLYVGGGVNLGVKYLQNDKVSRLAIGLDPTVGFEYKFQGSPIALALDYTPQINFLTSMNWQITAFKVRFVL